MATTWASSSPEFRHKELDRTTGWPFWAARLRSLTIEESERRSEAPLILLAFAFLIAYAWPVLDPASNRTRAPYSTRSHGPSRGAFAIDLLTRLTLTDNRRAQGVADRLGRRWIWARRPPSKKRPSTW